MLNYKQKNYLLLEFKVKSLKIRLFIWHPEPPYIIAKLVSFEEIVRLWMEYPFPSILPLK